MAELFKNMWNEQFFDGFTKALKCVIDDFDERTFLSQIIDNEWERKELMQRGMHISAVLKNFLPPDYKKAIAKIVELINCVKETPYWEKIEQNSLQGKFGLSLEYGFLSGFVEENGFINGNEFEKYDFELIQ